MGLDKILPSAQFQAFQQLVPPVGARLNTAKAFHDFYRAIRVLYTKTAIFVDLVHFLKHDKEHEWWLLKQ